MRLMRMTLALAALTTLTACDRAGSAEFSQERSSRDYRAAMDDYRAGRIPQALAGLKKTCSADPANASARFQLACLLQDHAKDYVGAFCAYREYLLQCPESEKSKLAKDRMSVCEREMAKALAERFAPQAVQDAVRSAQEIRAAQAKLESERAKLKAELDASAQALARLRQENDRLKRLMRDEAVADASGSDLSKEVLEAKLLMAEAPDEAASGAAVADEIADARSLIEKDAGAEPPPLLSQAADAKAKRTAAAAAEQEAKKTAAPLYPHEKRPATYVVQEGDTLYKIAVRFYGRRSAWKRIRDANKVSISTDGGVRAGQTIVLPPGEE